MVRNILDGIGDILGYLVTVNIFEIPVLIAYFGVSILVAYCTSMILIGIPCSIFESITNKKIPDGIEDKIICCLSVVLTVALFLLVLHERAT